MALTVTASLVVEPDGNWNPDPTGIAGWDNTSGDKTWVPDEYYYRRVLLELGTDASDPIPNIVRWEIYDGTTIPFVDDASAIVSDGAGGGNTADTAFVNDRTTRTVWASVGADPGVGEAWYVDTGAPWINTLRANGPRNVIEFPAYLKWDTGVGPDSMTFEIEAFTGPGGVPSATTSFTISKPDVSLIGGETGTPFPRSLAEPLKSATVEEDAPVVEEVEGTVEEGVEPEGDVESQEEQEEPAPKQTKRSKRRGPKGTG